MDAVGNYVNVVSVAQNDLAESRNAVRDLFEINEGSLPAQIAQGPACISHKLSPFLNFGSEELIYLFSDTFLNEIISKLDFVPSDIAKAPNNLLYEVNVLRGQKLGEAAHNPVLDQALYVVRSAARHIGQTPSRFKLKLHKVIPYAQYVDEALNKACLDESIDRRLRLAAQHPAESDRAENKH